jgi:putative pyruvate formate lyase activating enzyme
LSLPSYKSLSEEQWQQKLSWLKENYSPCKLCPRKCGALRQKNMPGVCGAIRDVKIASHNLHYGEEPPITGTKGSGTVFFSGCTLKCVFCQNYPISHLFNGTFYRQDQFPDILLKLQARGAHNINLVTGTPYLHHFVEALHSASAQGLSIPIVYNTSGYERPEVIEILDGIIDIYLPDLKYVDPEVSKRYTGASDYFEHAYPSLLEMVHQTGPLEVNENGIAVKGTILRHLIIPGEIENSRNVLDTLASSPAKIAHLSLMSQYFPAFNASNDPLINRTLTHSEYEEVKRHALNLGFDNGWFQDMSAQGKA